MQELAAQQGLRSACMRVLRAATLSLTSLTRHPGQASEVPRHMCTFAEQRCERGLSQATHRLALIFRTLSPRVKPSNPLEACPGPPAGTPSPTLQPQGLELPDTLQRRAASCKMVRVLLFEPKSISDKAELFLGTMRNSMVAALRLRLRTTAPDPRPATHTPPRQDTG
jgi:hypothetical protein